MRSRKSWMLYGAVVVVWVAAFGWRAHINARRNAEIAETSASNYNYSAQSQNSSVRLASDSEKKAACDSIKAQLEAFEQDDYSAANEYQSTVLKRNIGSTANFRTIIKNVYPRFAHCRNATFGGVFTVNSGKSLVVPVVLTGNDGVKIGAVYSMVRENGLYRVQRVNGGNTGAGSSQRAPLCITL